MEHRGFDLRETLQRLPRRHIYPLLGLPAGLCAPIGLLLARASFSGGAIKSGWASAQVQADPITWYYLTFMALVLFAAFGHLAGRNEDLLREQANSDPLTGLPNRRQFESRIREELARAARLGTPMSLLVIDLDNLKHINDSEGHTGGDEAIRRVAAAIRGSCRTFDLGARLGGDEFAVLASGARATDARGVAKRIRSHLAQSGEGAPTVSIGIAELTPSSAEAAKRLFTAADAALYAAKNSGRNRTMIAELHDDLDATSADAAVGRAPPTLRLMEPDHPPRPTGGDRTRRRPQTG